MPGLGTIIFSNRIGFALILIFITSLIAGEAIAAAVDKPGILATVLKWLPLIFKGFLMNVLVSVLSMSIGTVAGVMLGVGQESLIKYVRKISWFFTQFFRNAPWLVLVFYTIALIPFEVKIGPYFVPFPGWLKATIGLSLPVMANTSEIVRGGIQSIPLGQWESAESLAFSRFQTLWSIILPQCFKRMIPPWMNLYAILTTASPLISLVGVYDALLMTRSALMAEGRSELLLPMYSILLIMFFLYCYPIAYYTVKLERRYAIKS
ncbi:MAG: amino acid ABC transporter permease [Deltaproteobacteria bacterium]|nr:amino acid ABC transporter permease [Deltaproteobacteria bacterium]